MAMLVAWGCGQSSVEAVREAESDWTLSAKARDYAEGNESMPTWCVALEDTPAMREALDHDRACAGYARVGMIRSVTYRAIEGTDHEELREVREYCSGPVTLATVVDACREANCRATMFDEQGFACGSCDENGEWILN